jgi:thiol-disulfide isomerase/thioredoxin
MMKLKKLFGLMLVSISLLCCRATPPAEQSSSFPTTIRQISLSELDAYLASLKGKVVLIDYWATWCGPCRMEIPGLIKLQSDYGSKGLQVVGLSIDDRPVEQVIKFVKSAGINYSVFVVGENATKKWGGFEGIPMVYLLDTKGKKVWQHEGYAEAAVFEKQIKPLLPGA